MVWPSDKIIAHGTYLLVRVLITPEYQSSRTQQEMKSVLDEDEIAEKKTAVARINVKSP